MTGRLGGKLRRLAWASRPYLLWRSLRDWRALRKAFLADASKPQMQTATRLAVLFIGTSRYLHFFPPFYSSLRNRFLPATPKTFFVFTDRTKEPLLAGKKDVMVVPVPHQDFPRVNLLKFKFINQAKEALQDYSHIVYIDADMYADAVTSEQEFFCHDKPLFAVQHYNYVRKSAHWAFERNQASMAGVGEDDDLSIYWQACFWGGRRDAFLEAVRLMEVWTDIDLGRGIVAKWWDESFLNKYLAGRRAIVHTYPPSYAWPARKPVPGSFRMKLVHVDDNPDALRDAPSIKATIREKAQRGTT
ncbi:MAG: hypothetical protein V3T83_13975 [Acidobacteriota bacterium]